MKKSLIFGAALLALGFVSCDEENTLGIPQVNPQGTVLESNGVSVDLGAALTGSELNLNNYKDGVIPVIKLVSADELYGGSVFFTMQLADNENFDNATTLDVTDGSVSTQAWDDYFRSTLGRGPKAKPMYVRFLGYADVDGQLIRIGNTDTYFASKSLTVTPIPMDFTIESAYYLIGTINGWGLNNSYPMKHSDADVYDDPVFSITVKISEEEAAGGWWWKIAPQTAVDNADWGGVAGPTVDGDTSLEGKLIVGEGAQAGCIKQPGEYLMSINMEALTYKFEKVLTLYTPGNSNGWSQANSQRLTFNADKGMYMGFAHLNGEFKLSDQDNWDGTNYGNGGADGALSTDGGAGNLNAPVDGLYWLTVNTANLTYTATLITSLGVIGDMNGWGAQEAMTPSADFLTWTGDVTFGAGNGWKFRMNDDWGINLGGTESNLTFDGGNCPSPGDGTYTVTLDLSTVPYTYKAVKK